MAEKRLIVGLLAHVDAGKTTLSEALLYTGGQLRRLGRVDHGDAFLDTDVQERERGITIFSKQAMLQWKDIHLTLLDTPGHVDFSSEMERTLRVIDCAVLVISGADGVQGHTLTLWRLLHAYRVPTLLFINKMDHPGADRGVLMHALKTRLSDACVDLLAPGAMEEMAMCGETAMEEYLDTGAVSQAEIARLTAGRRLFPCLFGSALKLQGIEALLDALRDCVPAPRYPEAFSARVYKISRDPQGVRLAWMKITGGSLKVKTLLRAEDWEEKVNQLRLYSGQKFTLADAVPAGAVCAVTGLNYVKAGDGLGAEPAAAAPLLTPVFTYQVLLPVGCDPHTALQKLRILEEEDPQLHVLWNAEKREIHVQLMGEVQLEILRRVLRDRFQLAAAFSEGSILYRETIANAVEGVGHYEPLRHYAEVHLLLEPGEPGSGLHFASACSEDELDRNWQRLILTHLMEKQHLGVLTGAPITDMKITLIAGRAHLKHTEGGDFRQATYRAVRQGLMQAQSVLLEPWYDVRLELPQDCVGRAMNDLTQMGGSFQPPETLGEGVLLTGSAPVAALRGYAREVVSYTRGQGRLLCQLRGYAPCRDQESAITEAGYDPERDPENSPDSVFCSHGAGFIVKWDQVPQFMHLHTETLGLSPAPAALASGQPAGGAYRGTADEDRQLMAIFERTYGPVKERRGGAARQARPTVNDRPIVLQPPKQEYLLVDGYNIIFAWPDLKALGHESLEDARKSLQDILSNYRGFKPCELILVFDAYKVAGNPGSAEDYHGIHIVYTREAETADNYIEKTIQQIARKADSRVRVATSDALEQVIILGGGALRVSAKEFRAEVEAANVEIAEILRRNNFARDPVSNVERAMKAAMEKEKKQG
ncbi:MAG: TetM/TetW/TetO/TetS family tetracycline resistance ribosomal protection protein [Clostridia bacterium]|nr:TetM/TetW/TetO/TetS family tetracycline resistance ribosomal protection protein [Clostridia bacterium]